MCITEFLNCYSQSSINRLYKTATSKLTTIILGGNETEAAEFIRRSSKEDKTFKGRHQVDRKHVYGFMLVGEKYYNLPDRSGEHSWFVRCVFILRFYIRE